MVENCISHFKSSLTSPSNPDISTTAHSEQVEIDLKILA